MVTMPPDVVRTRASSTVLANASSLVNRDFAGMSLELGQETRRRTKEGRKEVNCPGGLLEMSGLIWTSGFVSARQWYWW